MNTRVCYEAFRRGREREGGWCLQTDCTERGLGTQASRKDTTLMGANALFLGLVLPADLRGK